MKTDKKLLIIGCGAIAQCALPLILKLMAINPKSVTIVDFKDNRERVKEALDRGVSYVLEQITEDNYSAVLSKYVSPGGMIIDLAWNIDTIALLEWCRDHEVLYVNTSVELWDPYKITANQDLNQYTLYHRQMELRKQLAAWGDNNGPTAVLDHGANPGLVSHFTKHALLQIAQKILKEKPRDSRCPLLERALVDKNFAKLAQLENVQVIHISERDTQITDKPKRVNEFVNTWSIEGFFEEGTAPTELAWGTHENYLPDNAILPKSGPKNQICFPARGMDTWVRSWVPSGEMTGMVIRHGETFGISDHLTVWEEGEAVYRPTVNFAYCPSDAAISSLHELEMRGYKMQAKQRIMNDEIIDGMDQMGVLLMGHDFKSWWCGSILNVHEARKHVPHQQATTVQVAISVVAAALWMTENPKKGVCSPDEIDYEFILKVCQPYISPFISEPVNWSPLDSLKSQFSQYNLYVPEEKDQWQFASFLVDHEQRKRLLKQGGAFERAEALL